MYVKVMEYKFCNGVLRWQMSNTTEVVPRIFVPALTVSDILTFQLFDPQKVGQGDGVHLRNEAIRLQV